MSKKKQELTKTGFVELIAKSKNITKVDADKAITNVLDTIREALPQNDKITFPGFGAFYISSLPAREGRNPKTEEIMQIKASKSVNC